MTVDQREPGNLAEDLDLSTTAEGNTVVGTMIYYTTEMWIQGSSLDIGAGARDRGTVLWENESNQLRI